METIFDEIQESVKNWWLSLILGIIFVGVGICLMFAPLDSYIALSIIFSITILISGIFEILFAVTNRHVSSWGWYLVGGIIDILIGIYDKPIMYANGNNSAIGVQSSKTMG